MAVGLRQCCMRRGSEKTKVRPVREERTASFGGKYRRVRNAGAPLVPLVLLEEAEMILVMTTFGVDTFLLKRSRGAARIGELKKAISKNMENGKRMMSDLLAIPWGKRKPCWRPL